MEDFAENYDFGKKKKRIKVLTDPPVEEPASTTRFHLGKQGKNTMNCWQAYTAISLRIHPRRCLSLHQASSKSPTRRWSGPTFPTMYSSWGDNLITYPASSLSSWDVQALWMARGG